MFFVNSYVSVLQSVLRAQFYHWMTESHCLLPGEFWEWAAWNFLYKTWMADRLSCIDGRENYFCIFNWDVLNKTWKWNFDALCLCCPRLQWLPKVKGQLSFTGQWRSVTVHIGFVPFLARLCLGVSLGDHGETVPLVEVSLVWPALPKEVWILQVRSQTYWEIPEDGFTSVCSKMIISCYRLLLHLFF